MAEYYGGDVIRQELKTNADILSIITSANNIVNARLIPENITSLKTINYYTIDSFSGSLEYFLRTWSADCRSDNEAESKLLAEYVYTALNRKTATKGGYEYFARCSIEPTLPPLTDSDVYNTPVTILLRRR